MSSSKKYTSIEEIRSDVESLKAQEHIYDPKFQQSSKPKEGISRNFIISFVSQLRPGIDASRIQAPIFVIKPFSFLEISSEYVCPHEFMVKITLEPTPEKRMLTVAKWIISNLTVTPQKGFDRMKPYNPIIGEQFLCKWNHEDSTTYFHAEQVLHHPPVSAFYMENKKYNWVYTSTTAPKSTFWGNKVDMTIDGEHILHLLQQNEKYKIEFPPIVGRGIIMGTSLVEHADSMRITCEQTGLEVKLDLKKKTNDFEGSLKKNKTVLYKITGNLFGKTYISAGDKKAPQELLLDSQSLQRSVKIVKPVAEQQPNESRRVWHTVTNAIYSGDYDAAGKYKHIIEEEQRGIAKQRKQKGEAFVPKDFRETDKKIRADSNVYEFKNINLTASTTTVKPEEEALDDIE